MGTDIQCFIEYRHPGDDYWFSLGERFNPPQDYDVFGRLSEVLSEVHGGVPAVAPRCGMPADTGQVSWDYNKLEILEIGDAEAEWYRNAGEAKQLVDSGASAYVYGRGEKPIWITHPDWYAHSWVTPDEWEEAIKCEEDDHVPQYRAMLAAMRELERLGYECRVVYWFDD